MSCTTLHVLTCEHEGCQTTLEIRFERTEAAARKRAREKHGWYCSKQSGPMLKDQRPTEYCPEHNPEKICPNCRQPMPCASKPC
jgi:hypothetical protein